MGTVGSGCMGTAYGHRPVAINRGVAINQGVAVKTTRVSTRGLRSGGTILIGTCLIGIGLVGFGTSSALAEPATRRVCFSDGRSIEAVAVSHEAGTALLTLPGGGSIAFPESRILRIEPIEPATLPEPPDPSQMADPVSDPATPSAGAIVGTSNMGEGGSAVSIESMIVAAALKYELEPELLAAVIAVESGYRPDAISPKGAQGLMQLMPATARELEVTDPLDPRQNIEGGARYLKQLLDGNDGQYWRALAAYNAGMGRVARYNGLPPYRETITYIRRVLDRYGKLDLSTVATDRDR